MGNNSAVIYEQYFRPWQQIKALEARLCEVIFTFRQSNFSYLVGLQAPIATLQSIEACITQHEARLGMQMHRNFPATAANTLIEV